MPVIALLETWLTALPWAALWMAAAAGFGRLVRPLVPTGATGPTVQLATGAALLLTLDAAAGRLGLLGVGAGAGAWLLSIAGLVLLLDQVRRLPDGAARLRPSLLWATGLPAAGALLLASASTPGWLWASEFGGYDALSYHLLLPREWMAAGASGGLEHNVYSFLPSYIETAFLHVAHLRGDAIAAAPACQMLHAGFAVLTAALVARLVRSATTRTIGVVAGLVVLDAARTDGPCARTGAIVGLLAAAACGAKLTAVGLVALPLAILLACSTGAGRGRLAALAAAAVVGSCTLLPWALGNVLDTGNPLFPLLTGWFGTGHWSAGQAARFAAGHGDGLGVVARLAAGWSEFGRYGLGPAPGPGTPWAPQWSILPWLALAGLAFALRRRALRGQALRLALVALVQIVFWLAATHVKSRFLLPFVVPGAALVALGGGTLVGDARWRRALTALLLLAWCALPAVLLGRERDGRPLDAVGVPGAFDGSLHAELIAQQPSRRAEIIAGAPPSFWINHLLPEGTRVAGVGAAACFYVRPDRMTYATVWDRGPLLRALDANDDDLDRAIAALGGAGFTHLLVDGTMLENWFARAWSDPRLDPDAVRAAADRRATIQRTFPGDVHLYALPAAPGLSGRTPSGG